MNKSGFITSKGDYRELIVFKKGECIYDLTNLAITMIHQEIYLLVRLIEKAKKDFLENGGIREEMSRARREYRNSTGNYGNKGSNGKQWEAMGSNGN